MAGIRNGGNSRFEVILPANCALQVTRKVDGRRIAELATGNCARAGGEELKKRFPMLQIIIYDAKTNAREEIQIPNSSFPLVRVRQVPDRALVNRAAQRLGHPASIPRAIMSRSPEALAFGSRRHFIPASLSLPLCGCLLNRSRDCSRSRVPPRFSRRRYADAPAAASLSCLRFASARSSPVTGGRKLEVRSEVRLEPHVPLGSQVRFRGVPEN